MNFLYNITTIGNNSLKILSSKDERNDNGAQNANI